MSTDKEYIELQEFIKAAKEVRKSFIIQARFRIHNDQFRKSAENVLLMYNQMLGFLEKN